MIASIAIQSLGTLSAFALVPLISRFGGATLQGEFGTIKAWVDLCGVVVQFGLPQAFIYAINVAGVQRSALLKISFWLSIAAFPAVLISTATVNALGYFQVYIPLHDALLVTASVALLLFHRLTRNILLTLNDGFPFAAFTILPSVALLGTTALSLPTPIGLAAAFAMASLIAFAGASVVAGYVVKWDCAPKSSLPFRMLFQQSRQAFLTAVIATAQPVVLFWLMSLSAPIEAVGYLNVALLPTLAAGAVLSMVAPLLYNQWSKGEGTDRLAIIRKSLPLAAALTPLVAACSLAIPFLVNVVFGAEFVAAELPGQLALMAVPPLLISTIMSASLLSAGHSWIVTTHTTVKFSLTVFAYLALRAVGFEEVISATMAWVLGEWGGASTCYIIGTRTLTVRI